MKPVGQTIVGNGRDGRPMGDCLRACVASIFELPIEDVPHFAAESNWLLSIWAWLRPRGMVLDLDSFSAPSDDPIPVGHRWPSGWWIASVDSEYFPGHGHAVVMRGYYTRDGSDAMNRVAHDPSPRPRSTPYRFSHAYSFALLDPAVALRGRAS